MKIDEIIVKTVNEQRLIDFLKIQLQENEFLVVDNFCIYEDKFGIDIDSCSWELNQEHFENEIQTVIKVECRIKTKTPTGSIIRTDKPDFIKTISLKDYVSISTEVKLIDFIRYNYNPRIISNQQLLMKYINKD